MATALTRYDAESRAVAATAPADSVFGSADALSHGVRAAKALAQSSLVPEQFRGNIANCLIALETAARVRVSPLAVMQNLDVIHGRPSWRAQFIIAAINASGRFSPLRFRMEGTGDDRACTAWARDLDNGDVLEGPAVSIHMAKEEGWVSKNGSKWRTMPELMLRYRAASFFGRLYAPDILAGMRVAEDEPTTDMLSADRALTDGRGNDGYRMIAAPEYTEPVEETEATVVIAGNPSAAEVEAGRQRAAGSDPYGHDDESTSSTSAAPAPAEPPRTPVEGQGSRVRPSPAASGAQTDVLPLDEPPRAARPTGYRTPAPGKVADLLEQNRQADEAALALDDQRRTTGRNALAEP